MVHGNGAWIWCMDMVHGVSCVVGVCVTWHQCRSLSPEVVKKVTKQKNPKKIEN